MFAITFDPRLPSIPQIVNKHYRTMVADPHLAEAFPLPPLIAYKRQKNIRDKIIRREIPTKPPTRPQRHIPGMTSCHNCPICPFVQPGKLVKATATNFKIDVNRQVNCQTINLVYCVECKLCSMQYIGETDRSLQSRFSEHKGYVSREQLTRPQVAISTQ